MGFWGNPPLSQQKTGYSGAGFDGLYIVLLALVVFTHREGTLFFMVQVRLCLGSIGKRPTTVEVGKHIFAVGSVQQIRRN